MKYSFLILITSAVFILQGCSDSADSLNKLISELEGIQGTKEYQSSSYITAGNRLYSVGSQDGTFPEIGWHIDGEMGGIWNHPIKLMDGFAASITAYQKDIKLNNAQSFVNYPFANQLKYSLAEFGLEVSQSQFVPDHKEALIIEYQIHNLTENEFKGLFDFNSYIDLRPTWLGERTNMVDGSDQLTYNENESLLVAKDENNEWYCIIGANRKAAEYEVLESPYKGNGQQGKLVYELNIPPKEFGLIKIYVSGSYQSKTDALETLNEIRQRDICLLEEKELRYHKIEENTRLTTSDESFNQIFRWIKYNSDWFIREVPEIGRGIAAGYPDYPWWFGCDSEYALQGYMSVGQFELVEENIQLLADLSEKTNSNGRIIHEASTNGAVFNKGNVNETPQFISLIWNAYLWTGNKELLVNNLELIKKGLKWIEDKDLNKNMFPEGAGMMEIHGLESEMIDVASYTQKAYEDAANIFNELGESGVAKAYEQKAEELRNKINIDFWADDFSSYADFIGEDKETLELIEDAIVRADTLKKPWAVEELSKTKKYIIDNPSDNSRPFVLHHNWVVNTPMEMGIADYNKAIRALETGRKFVNPFGIFVTGIDRDESAGKEFGSFKGTKQFSYTGAVMTLPTGVSAIAENNYGNPDQALDYLTRMGRSFSFALPGSIYEVSPDYGMFAQAWNIYSYAVPVVQQFFGVKPNAYYKRIMIQPLMPSAWDFANLENLRIGSNQISLFYTKEDNGYKLLVSSTEAGWDIEVLPSKDHQLDQLNKISKSESEYVFIKK